MTDVILRYRLVLVTALIAAAAVLRVARPEWVVPTDNELAAWADAVLAATAPIVWAYTYYKTDTSKNSFQEYVDREDSL